MSQRYKVTMVMSNGRDGRSFQARDAAHADRIKQRLRSTFKQGSSAYVRVTAI